MADLSELYTKLEKEYGFPHGRFVKDGQYEILAEHSDCRLRPHASVPEEHDGFFTYLAKNTKTEKCVLIRVHGLATSALEETKNELEVLDSLKRVPEAENFIILPIETFQHKGPKGQYLCWVLDMIGPDFQYITEYGGPEDNVFPASMVWKLAKEGLEALAFLHSQDICHGYLQKASLVLTYPHLNNPAADAAMDFFGQPDSLNGLSKLNDTCTDKVDEPMRLDFKLKLTGLVKAFPTSADPPNPSKTYIHFDAPPPELLFDNKVQPSVDIWDLAVILTDLASAHYEFANLLSGDPSSDSRQKLLHTRKYLNQLPSKYLDKVPHGQQYFGTYDEKAFYDAITKEPFASDKPVFEDAEYGMLVKLLRRMLAYAPEERCTAEEALREEFFEVQRPK